MTEDAGCVYVALGSFALGVAVGALWVAYGWAWAVCATALIIGGVTIGALLASD